MILSLKPLIKWPGGKTSEIKIFSKFLPNYKRYFEPFFGGGAVYFFLKPQNAYINDYDSNLISFYNSIKNQDREFFDDINHLNYNWNLLDIYVNSHLNDFLNIIQNNRLNQNLKWSIPFDIEKFNFIEDNNFDYYLNTSINSKIQRILKLEKKHNKYFDLNLLKDHFETSVKSAFYICLRDQYFNTSSNKLHNAAVFYFIREFCYGSMFRYNSNGKYNIPYGGINYNKKDFTSKIKNLQKREIIDLFNSTEIYNIDFEKFLKMFNFRTSDFIFLDPPYDSDFKKYNNHIFTKQDQKRLASILKSINAKWLLVIQKNDYISDLYRELQKYNSKINIIQYEKNYTYNVRGRNIRETTHLLIKNY